MLFKFDKQHNEILNILLPHEELNLDRQVENLLS